MASRAVLPIIRFVAAISVLAVLASVLQKYVNVALPHTPFVFGLAVVVLLLALYGNSVAWRKFLDRQKGKPPALLGGSPTHLRSVLDEVERLLPQDPLAAQRALEAYSRPLRQRSHVQRERLWQRAPQDRAALHELERALQEDLTAHRAALEQVRGMLPNAPSLASVVSDLETEVTTTQQQLTKVHNLLARGGNADGAA